MPRLLFLGTLTALMFLTGVTVRSCPLDVTHGLALAQAFYKNAIVYQQDGEETEAVAEWDNLAHQLHLVRLDMGSCADEATNLTYNLLSAEYEARQVPILISGFEGMVKIDGANPSAPDPDFGFAKNELTKATMELHGYLSEAYRLGLAEKEPKEYARLKRILQTGYSTLGLPYVSPEN